VMQDPVMLTIFMLMNMVNITDLTAQLMAACTALSVCKRVSQQSTCHLKSLVV
jgi:hypothetical protein